MIATDPSMLDFNGARFNSVELNWEFWLRADELGGAAGLEHPEPMVLALWEAHADQLPARLTALAGVETPDGPRLMRVFNPLGAYVVLTFLDTPGTRLVRRWLLEALAYLQIDVKREIARLTEEDRRLRAYFEAAIQALAEEVRKLREAHAARDGRDWMEGEFRHWHEAQAGTALSGAREPPPGVADSPAAPTQVLACQLFKVYAGEIDGRPATLVNARDLHGFLGSRLSFLDWWEERRRWAGFRSGIHHIQVPVTARQYDYYLTLDAADNLLCQESHPKTVEAHAYLMEVAREKTDLIDGGWRGWMRGLWFL